MKITVCLFLFVVFLFVVSKVCSMNFATGISVGNSAKRMLQNEIFKLKKDLEECRRNIGECKKSTEK